MEPHYHAGVSPTASVEDAPVAVMTPRFGVGFRSHYAADFRADPRAIDWIEVIADPFMGSGSTVAAAEALGLSCVGVERYQDYFDMAKKAVPTLALADTRSFAKKEAELETQLGLL